MIHILDDIQAPFTAAERVEVVWLVFDCQCFMWGLAKWRGRPTSFFSISGRSSEQTHLWIQLRRRSPKNPKASIFHCDE